MRGEVIKPDDDTGPGLILGEDGRRYTFLTARVHKAAVLAPGAPVDFIALGEEARDIYTLTRPAAAPAATRPPAANAPAIAARSDGLFTYFQRALSKNYFQFYGRARRAEYWGYILFFLIFMVIAVIADVFLATGFGISGNAADPGYVPMLSALFYLYSIIPGIAVTVRRFHDQDMSGWLYLLNAIPYIGGVIVFIIMLFDSQHNPNRHGPSPKYGPAQTIDVFS